MPPYRDNEKPIDPQPYDWKLLWHLFLGISLIFFVNLGISVYIERYISYEQSRAIHEREDEASCRNYCSTMTFPFEGRSLDMSFDHVDIDQEECGCIIFWEPRHLRISHHVWQMEHVDGNIYYSSIHLQ